jgi:hypothetical protein
MKAKTLIFALSFLLNIDLHSQIPKEAKLYVIQLASLNLDKQLDASPYEKLKHYGVVFKEKTISGINKIYLKRQDGLNFVTKQEANLTLKAIKNIRAFRKAFVVEKGSDMALFNQPSMQYKDRELVISLKLNEPFTESKSVPINNPNKISNLPKEDFYAIKIASVTTSKTNLDIAGDFHLDASEMNTLISRAKGKFRVFYFGQFKNERESQIALKKLVTKSNCDQCQNDDIKVVLFKAQGAGHVPED